jgi:hypothetical protein
MRNVWDFIKHEIPEMLDNWRVIPRLLIFLYAIVFYETMTWFMSLPEPNNAQAGFVSVIVGAGAAWFGLYVNSGSGKKVRIETTGTGSKTS